MRKAVKHTPIPTKQHELLLRLINSPRKQSNKIFDKKDNCFIPRSFRDLEYVSGESKSSLQRLFTTLRNQDLTREVLNEVNERVRMLNPSFIHVSDSKYDSWFKKAMYHLGSYSLACEWASYCRKDSILYDYNNFSTCEVIDISTGEVTHPNMTKRRNLTTFEVYDWNKYRESYSSVDRTKRRHLGAA